MANQRVSINKHTSGQFIYKSIHPSHERGTEPTRSQGAPADQGKDQVNGPLRVAIGISGKTVDRISIHQ